MRETKQCTSLLLFFCFVFALFLVILETRFFYRQIGRRCARNIDETHMRNDWNEFLSDKMNMSHVRSLYLAVIVWLHKWLFAYVNSLAPVNKSTLDVLSYDVRNASTSRAYSETMDCFRMRRHNPCTSHQIIYTSLLWIHDAPTRYPIIIIIIINAPVAVWCLLNRRICQFNVAALGTDPSSGREFWIHNMFAYREKRVPPILIHDSIWWQVSLVTPAR